MNHRRPVKLLYGREGADLQLPSDAIVLSGKDPPAVANPAQAVASALADPIGTPPLIELIRRRRPETVAITVSDITRPVPNRQFLPAMLDVLAEAGVGDEQISIIIGTGMHRPSTPEERDFILGREVLERLEVIDHTADRPETLTRVSDDPPVSVCTRFAEADFRIVTGYIEPHFMAGFSGGRKGVFPALVDLASIQRFHGFDILANPLADNGILDGNPCHEIALELAQDRRRRLPLQRRHHARTRNRRHLLRRPGRSPPGGMRGGRRLDHRRGSRPPRPGGHLRRRVSARSDLLPDRQGHVHRPARSGAGYDPAAGLGLRRGPRKSGPTPSSCSRWGSDWRGFLAHIEANRHETKLDQWELQVQCRVLERIGSERLWFATDGIPAELQGHLGLTPLLGEGDAIRRAQRAIDDYLSDSSRRPGSRHSRRAVHDAAPAERAAAADRPDERSHRSFGETPPYATYPSWRMQPEVTEEDRYERESVRDFSLAGHGRADREGQTAGRLAAAADPARQDAGVPGLLRDAVQEVEGGDRGGGQVHPGRRPAQPRLQPSVSPEHRQSGRRVPLGRRRQPLHRFPAGGRAHRPGQQLRTGARQDHRGAPRLRSGDGALSPVRARARQADQPAHAVRRDVSHAGQRLRGGHGRDSDREKLHRQEEDHQGRRRLPRLERPAGIRYAPPRHRCLRGSRHPRGLPPAHPGVLPQRHRRRARPACPARAEPGQTAGRRP